MFPAQNLNINLLPHGMTVDNLSFVKLLYSELRMLPCDFGQFLWEDPSAVT